MLCGGAKKGPAQLRRALRYALCFVPSEARTLSAQDPTASIPNGRHCLFAFALRKFDLLGATHIDAITACLTWIKCADLQKRYRDNNVFPVARQRNVKFVIGSSLNAGFISGSPRYNYGKTSWNIPRQYIEKRERLRAVAAQFGADLRTAALQFSAAPDVAAALIVGAHTEAQVLANVSSMQATIPPEFWAELKRQNLIEQNAPTPTVA